MKPKIIAQQDNSFLVKTEEKGIFPFGHIVNMDEHKVTRGVNLYSVMKMGFWDEPSITVEQEKEILKLMKEGKP